MIFPGHVAASLLCHRYLKVDLRVALVAGITPDLIDKGLYYGLHLVPNSRVPMHTLLGWSVSTMLVIAIAWTFYRPLVRAWGAAWFVGYGAHLLCDSPLVGGKLPFLWPWLNYDFTSAHLPLGFLFGLDRWPVTTLVAESVLVIFTLWNERRIRTETKLIATG